MITRRPIKPPIFEKGKKMANGRRNDRRVYARTAATTKKINYKPHNMIGGNCL